MTNMNRNLKIGMIGLDTSHAVTFAELLNSGDHPFRVSGGRVIAAYPGGSDDFKLSSSRVKGYTATLHEKFGVEILPSPEAVAESCDAILLTSVDGRAHRKQFEKIVSYKRPTFIDKPFAVNSTDAVAIVACARERDVPLMSASSLRFTESLEKALSDDSQGPIIGADFFGPMELEPTQPGLFWYGVHTVEMLFTTLGKGCRQVTAITNEDHDVITGLWRDGRIGAIRGNRKGNSCFGGVVHRKQGSQFVNPRGESGFAKHARLLEQVIEMFNTGISSADLDTTLETVRFMEAANESRDSGRSLPLRLATAAA